MRRRVALAVLLLAVLTSACATDGGSGNSDDAANDRTQDAVTRRVAYDNDPLQFGDLTVPAGEGPFAVVVFIHGGFWRNGFGLDLAEPQAADAADRGYATWNVEYRRVGDTGGAYPGTLLDIASAIDHLAVLADEHPLDLDRVAIVGHSAGGHLALWAGQRAQLPSGVPGADPAVVPLMVVGQAPVADLAGNLDLGGGAVVGFMGTTPAADPAAYDIADPARLLPVVAPQLIVQGSDDTIVPPDRAEAYVALAESSSEPGRVELESFAGADHFDVIDPAHPSWQAVLAHLPPPQPPN
ncbi:MAG: alpha/beta hydrolase [Acidimicrobiales bacterium]